MNRYVIANAAGEIIRTVICGEDAAEQQAQPGETLVAHPTATAATHWVNSGVVVAYSAAESLAKSVRPDPAATWSNATMSWADPRTLDQLREAQWLTIKAAREAVIYGTFTWDGSKFQCDPNSVALLQLALASAQKALQSGAAFAEPWTLSDNTVRTLSAADVFSVMGALGAQITAAFSTGRDLRAAIDAATTPEGIAAVKWPS